MYLPYFVDRRLAMLKQTPKQADDGLDQNNTVGNDAIGELEKRILYRARNAARKWNHRMTIIADIPKTRGNDLKNFCAQGGIDFLQLVLPKEDPNLTFGKHDNHWNHRTHKMITEQLLSQFETKIRPAVEDD